MNTYATRRIAAAMLAVTLRGTVGCIRETAAISCLTRDHVTVAPGWWDTGNWPGWNGTWIPNGSAIDARGALFDGSTEFQSGVDENGNARWFRGGIKVPPAAGSRADVCLVGGTVFTSLDPEMTPWDTWHQAYAVTVQVPDFHVIGTRVTNHGDAFAFDHQASDWRLTGVAVDGRAIPGFLTYAHGYTHDDCVQNDGLNSGRIVGSKFDGCYVFLSHQNGAGTRDGTGQTVEITDTLVHLRPYHSAYKPEIYGTDTIGSFFKLSGPTPKPRVVIRDSMFRADQPAGVGSLALPPDAECHGTVVLVGVDTWAASDLISWLDACGDQIRLGTAADWNTAVAAWDEANPPYTRP